VVATEIELLCGGFVDLTLLGLVFASAKEDEFALLGSEACDVRCKLLLPCAFSLVINVDCDNSGKGGAKSGALKLSDN